MTINMERQSRFPLMLAALLILLASLVLYFPVSDFFNSYTNDIDKDIGEIANIIALGYQVDVEVNSAHVTTHPDSHLAMKCLSNRGNISTFSEFKTRRLHLLCWDEETKTLYDIIINRINYYVDKWSNPKSHLITAYAPEGVKGSTMIEKSTYYINHLMETVGGKIVNLKFGPGEIMFIPK